MCGIASPYLISHLRREKPYGSKGILFFPITELLKRKDKNSLNLFCFQQWRAGYKEEGKQPSKKN